MGKLIKIQDSIFVEKCLVCGSRPIIEQIPGGKFIVRCKANAEHYKTNPGMVDINKWNADNRSNPETDDNIKYLKRG